MMRGERILWTGKARGCALGSVMAAASALLAGCSGATSDGDENTAGADAASPPVDAGEDHGQPDAAIDREVPDAGTSEDDPAFREDFAGLEGGYASGDSLGEWTVISAVDEALVVATADEGIDASLGDNALRFSSYLEDSGFGDSRLDRCESLDPARSATFSFSVLADLDSGAVDDVFRVRINPNFYADLEACELDVADGETDRRLEEDGSWYNEDFDVRLFSAGATAGEWMRVTVSTHGDQVGEMRIPADLYPEGAGAIRFSVRLRDRALPEDASRRLYIDDVQLSQCEEPHR